MVSAMISKVLVFLRKECGRFWRASLETIPGEIGCWLRNAVYGFSASPGCRVLRGVTVYHPDGLRLDRNVGIAKGCQLNARGQIHIGQDTLLGPNCVIWSQDHVFSDLDVPIRSQGYQRSEVVIEADCWLASGVTVLRGVHLGRGCVVAAGAVVNQSFPDFSIIGGVPARVLGTRNPMPENPSEEANESVSEVQDQDTLPQRQ